MTSRRSFLKAAMAFAMALPLGGLAGGAVRAQRVTAGGGAGFFIVDGWILSAGDVETLRRHDL